MTAEGFDVLADAGIAKIGPLNAAALGRYTLPAAPASLAGLQLFAQAVFFDAEGLDAVTSVRPTNIQP